MESHNIISFSFLRCMDKELMSIHGIVDLEDEDVAVNLELSQPQNVDSEKSGTPTLG